MVDVFVISLLIIIMIISLPFIGMGVLFCVSWIFYLLPHRLDKREWEAGEYY
jgi:hypothetical protein